MTIQTRWRAQVEGRKARQHFENAEAQNALMNIFHIPCLLWLNYNRRGNILGYGF